MAFHGCSAQTANTGSLGHTQGGNHKTSNAASLAHWLRNGHLEGSEDERHCHGSAGILLVGREHKMPE